MVTKKKKKPVSNQAQIDRIKAGSGASRREAQELAASRAKAAGIPETSSEFPVVDPEKRGQVITTPGQIQADIRKEAGEVAQSALEEAGAFEEVTPKKVPLKQELVSDIPFVSPSGFALSQVVPERSILGILRDAGSLPNTLPPIKTGEEAFPIPETPETLREAALREISIKTFNKGVSRREKFGTMMESIPLLGRLGRTWVGDLVEAPSANADEVIRHMDIIKEDASTGQEKVRNNLEDPEFGLSESQEMEEDIAELEGRLALLINTSPVLQANTDEIDRIERGVLSAKKKVSRYKVASSFGLTAQLTGAGRVVPTDEQIFFELKG